MLHPSKLRLCTKFVRLRACSHPFGGGGIACGIASAIRELKPEVRIIVAESDAATPVAAAVRLLFEDNHVVVEGAGAIPVAGALADNARFGKTVCVITGGNIDRDVMAKILQQQL